MRVLLKIVLILSFVAEVACVATVDEVDGGVDDAGASALPCGGHFLAADGFCYRVRPAAPLPSPRSGFTMTLLLDGRVLLAGGFTRAGNNGQTTRAALLYNYETDTWVSAPNMTESRTAHTANLLPDGRVLVCGGLGENALATCEFFDPVAGGWTPGPTMGTSRLGHSSATLADGRVVVAGGMTFNLIRYTRSTEMFFPMTNSWVPLDDISEETHIPKLVALNDDSLLLTGGLIERGQFDTSDAYVRLPGSESWQSIEGMRESRAGHSMTLLLDDRVLVVGAVGRRPVEVFDPLTWSFRYVGGLNQPRFEHAAVLIPDGRVMVFGGSHLEEIARTMEVYSPESEDWTEGPPLLGPHSSASAVLLPNDSILLADGSCFVEDLEVPFCTTMVERIDWWRED